MSYLQAILIGIVEGFTEFLPISSTAHLALTAKLLQVPESEFLKSFIVIIQLGAILAVVILYFRKLFTNFETMKRLAVAFIPTAVVGFGLYKIIKGVFLESTPIMLVTLFLGGVALIFFERFHKPNGTETESSDTISYKQSFWIGCAQALAVVPGVSRAAATIVGGMLLGVSKKAIIEFSFLLAVPTMVAATGYDLLKRVEEFSGGEWDLLTIGFVTSFVFALVGIRFLLTFVGSKRFTGFGIYRIFLAVLLGYLLL